MSETLIAALVSFITPLLVLVGGWLLGRRKQKIDLSVSLGEAYQGLVSASHDSVESLVKMLELLKEELETTKADLAETRDRLAQLAEQNVKLIAENEELTTCIAELKADLTILREERKERNNA